MKNLIDELYDLDIFRLTELDSESNEYKSTFNRLIELEENLLKSYPDCKDIFIEYQITEGNLHSMNNHKEFRKGFQAGAKIMMEILTSMK